MAVGEKDGARARTEGPAWKTKGCDHAVHARFFRQRVREGHEKYDERTLSQESALLPDLRTFVQAVHDECDDLLQVHTSKKQRKGGDQYVLKGFSLLHGVLASACP